MEIKSQSEFEVNGENKFWIVRYTQSTAPHGTFSITDKETGHIFVEGMLDRMRVVRTFYESFVEFAKSNRYVPREWEFRSIGKAWEDALQGKFSRYEVADYLLTLCPEDAILLEYRLSPLGEASYALPERKPPLVEFGNYIKHLEKTCATFRSTVPPPDTFGFCSGYYMCDTDDIGCKREELVACIAESDGYYPFMGFNLRLLRSYPVELALGMVPFKSSEN